MNKFIWLLACFISVAVSAQQKMVVMGKAPDMYVLYPTNGMESLQNISSQFGMSVAKLSAFNNININPSAPFPKGTQLKVPFTKDNLLQHPNDNTAPLYHVIVSGENLYRLSLAYNKVPIATLKEWNNMKSDLVKDGQAILIGYLVNGKAVEKKTDPPKDIPATNNSTTVSQPTPEQKYLAKKEPPVTAPVKKDKALDSARYKVDVKEMKTTDDKTVIADTKKKDPPVSTPASKTNPVTETKKKEEPLNAEYFPREGDEGYFASAYAEHTKEQSMQFHSGDAAIFKSISGWTDRKFYVLMNDIAPKTIVRITGPTNKSICAMVLGPLQETKGASGLLLRVSNSAASALGLTDPKFTVAVNYFE